MVYKYEEQKLWGSQPSVYGIESLPEKVSYNSGIQARIHRYKKMRNERSKELLGLIQQLKQSEYKTGITQS